MPRDCDSDRQPKWQCSCQNRKYLFFWKFQRKIWGFGHAQLEETAPGCSNNDGQQEMAIYTFWAPILLFSAVHRCRNHLDTLLLSSSWSKIPYLPLEFRCYLSYSSGCISISGFNGDIAILGCRPVLQSLADTFIELYVVVNSRFGVGILMLSLIVSKAKPREAAISLNKKLIIRS